MAVKLGESVADKLVGIKVVVMVGEMVSLMVGLMDTWRYCG